MTVHQLKTQSEIEREQEVASVIECLEGALESAKQGRIQSIALAVIRPDGSIASLWSEGTACQLLGALSFAQHRLCIDSMAPDSSDI